MRVAEERIKHPEFVYNAELFPGWLAPKECVPFRGEARVVSQSWEDDEDVITFGGI